MRGFFGIACALFLLAVPVGPAEGQTLRPIVVPRGDCRDASVGRGGGNFDWRETVNLEHCDRIQRLWSITQRSYLAPPQFYDGAVMADRLPRDIGVDMPILRVVFPERVFFDTDQHVLRPEAMEVVRIMASNLRGEPPDVALFVAGHADMRGSREHNAALSSRRANAVAEAIRREGINLASVWRVGFGEDMPLDRGTSDDALGRNRRVEFLFAGRPEVISQWMADGQLDMLCYGSSRTCVTTLPLDSAGYDIIEVGPPPVIVTPGQNSGAVSPNRRPPTVLNPTPTRRIRIDPVNRRSGPVERSS